MILHNPTDEAVTIQYEGVVYEIDPQSNSKDLGGDVADFWLRTHEFLVPVKEEEVVEKPKKTAKKEDKEDK